jgi:hypothetical protein
MTNPAAQTAARFTVTALVTWAGDVTRTPIGCASSRRAARRLAYRRGIQFVPSRFSVASFDLEIVDTATGAPVRAGWAEAEMLRRRDAQQTVAERGIW